MKSRDSQEYDLFLENLGDLQDMWDAAFALDDEDTLERIYGEIDELKSYHDRTFGEDTLLFYACDGSENESQ